MHSQVQGHSGNGNNRRRGEQLFQPLRSTIGSKQPSGAFQTTTSSVAVGLQHLAL